MTAPERIWATHSETWGAVELGQWADTVRHKGGEPYVHERLYTAQQETIAALVEALRWYADKVGDCRKLTREGDIARTLLDHDQGQTARAALARAKEQA